MKSRPLKMDAWGVSFDAYKELYHFCQQYERKKREVADLLTLPSSMPDAIVLRDGSGYIAPRGHAATDPVSAAADRRERLMRDVRMIEQAALAADVDLYPYILRAVTTRCRIADIAPPCGVNQFVSAKRRFYLALWQLRNGV